MEAFRQQFGYHKLVKESRPLLGENFVFEVGDYDSLKGYKIVHQEISLIETSLILIRDIFLGHTENQNRTLQLRLHLCWNGFTDALKLLFNYPRNFQRHIPIDVVVNTAEQYQIGDIGLAWSWMGKDVFDILAFVRNNVFITLAQRAEKQLIQLASEMDTRFKSLDTTVAYSEAPSTVFSELQQREGKVPKLPARGRLIIGTIPPEIQTSFFLTTNGSVNRDPQNPDVWYYRAGSKKGRQEILCFWVDVGILPKQERLSVDVDVI